MVAETRIRHSHWTAIVERIHEGLCVPFLGAGVNVSCKGYDGLPLGGEVARQLLRYLIAAPENARIRYLWQDEAAELLGWGAGSSPRAGEGTPPVVQERGSDDAATGTLSRPSSKDALLDSLVTVISHSSLDLYKDLVQPRLYDLARVALYLEAENDSTFLMKHLEELLADTECTPSILLQTLAQLPFKLIVSTNYDRLMERALQGIRPHPYEPVFQPIKGFIEAEGKALNDKLEQYKTDQGLEPSEYGPILYKIHGTLPPRANDPVLITEEDYIQFLTVIGQEWKGIPTTIKSLMKTSSLLFLGYSLQDWDFRTLYKALIEPLGPRRRLKSFAIQKDPSDFWVRFWEDKDVVIYNVDLYEFAHELGERYQRYVTDQR